MSTARFNTLQNAAGSKSVPVDTVVDGSAKAWVNFNGTGTVAIRAAFNVSSITDFGVGQYTVNFTTAMSDANYAVSVTSADGNIGGVNPAAFAQLTSAVRVIAYFPSTFVDVTQMNVAIFR